MIDLSYTLLLDDCCVKLSVLDIALCVKCIPLVKCSVCIMEPADAYSLHVLASTLCSMQDNIL